MSKKGLNNPLVVAAASNPDLVKEGTNVVVNQYKQAVSTGKIIITAAAVGFTSWYLWGKFRTWQKQQFIQDNAHIPDVQAAMIFRKAMKRIEPLSFPFNWISIPDGTDEATLNQLATQISSLANVIKAYKVLFDDNMMVDIYSELNNNELQKFFDKLNSKGEYESSFNSAGQLLPQIPLKVGQTIVVKNPSGATVWEAEEVNGVWRSTGKKLDFKKYGETIGTIEKVYKSKSTPQHFYVVDRAWIVDSIFGYGWLNHTDVKVEP